MVNAVLNCLSLEICPHRDTWKRWEGHAVRNRVKGVDGSFKEAHARPVYMSTMLTITPTLQPLRQWTEFCRLHYYLLGFSLAVYV